MLKEHGDKATPDVKAKIEEKKKAVVSAKAGDDPKAIDKAVEDLFEASQEIAKKLYEEAAKTQAAAGGGAPPTDAKTDDDDVIEGGFEKK